MKIKMIVIASIFAFILPFGALAVDTELDIADAERMINYSGNKADVQQPTENVL